MRSSEKLGRQEGMAIQYGNLGLIYRTRGEIDRVEAMLKKALAIDEKLGYQEGMANQYRNLGLIAKDRGDFARARELCGPGPATRSPRSVCRTGSRWCRAGSMVAAGMRA